VEDDEEKYVYIPHDESMVKRRSSVIAKGTQVYSLFRDSSIQKKIEGTFSVSKKIKILTGFYAALPRAIMSNNLTQHLIETAIYQN